MTRPATALGHALAAVTDAVLGKLGAHARALAPTRFRLGTHRTILAAQALSASAAPVVQLRILEILRHEASPLSERAAIRIERVRLALDVLYPVAGGDGGSLLDVQTRAADDGTALHDALTTPGVLAQTAAAVPSGLVSGRLERDGSALAIAEKHVVATWRYRADVVLQRPAA